MAAQAHDSDRALLGPEQYPDPQTFRVGVQELSDMGRQVRQVFRGHDLGPRTHDQVPKTVDEGDLRRAYFFAVARPPGSPTPVGRTVGVGEVHGAILRRE